MLFPTGDDNPILVTPWLVLGIVALNTLVFLFTSILPAAGQEAFIHDFGSIPAQLTGHAPAVGSGPEWVTLLTSAFLHGSFGHLFVNMYILLMFGDNIEYAFGRLRFIFFYLMACIVSDGLQLLMIPESDIPGIGASGAVAAVLGAYAILYPRAPVDVLTPLEAGMYAHGLAFEITLPSWFVILSWFAADFYFTFTGTVVEKMMEHGIGYLAHVSGFVMGLLLAHLLRVNYTSGDLLDIKRDNFRERAAARRRTREWKKDDSWRDDG